ncbi:MAG: VOC family protein [Solirubrobacteraceae bacterium]
MSSSRTDLRGPSALGVYPCLTYRDVRRALTWLHAAFGIEGQPLAPPAAGGNQPLDHALLRTNGGTILVESERPEELHGPHAGHGWIYVAVPDADTHYQQATSAGAHVHGKPHDFGEAFRGYSASDLEGNLWTFGTAQP